MTATGKWNVLVKAPHGDVSAVCDFVESGSSLAGTITRAGEQVHISDGNAQGDKLIWKCAVTRPVAGILTFAASVSGNVITGEVTGPTGVAKISGTKS